MLQGAAGSDREADQGELEKLHQFLREEEEARLTARREEEKEKGKMIAREKEHSGPDHLSYRNHPCWETEPAETECVISQATNTPRQAPEPSSHCQIHSWSQEHW